VGEERREEIVRIPDLWLLNEQCTGYSTETEIGYLLSLYCVAERYRSF
jgi:hypothetical protein